EITPEPLDQDQHTKDNNIEGDKDHGRDSSQHGSDASKVNSDNNDTLLSTSDNDDDTGEAVLRNFRGTLQLERTSNDNLAAFRALFRLGDKDAVSPKSKIRIPGMKIDLFPYQAFGVWYMLQEEGRCNGGFLADDVGLGKTIIILAHIVVSSWIKLGVMRVAASRAKNDGGHLPANAVAGSVCPSMMPYLFECPCVPGSATARLQAQHQGANLVIVPKKLTGY
ncbi:hypothetical protein BJX70DRAFT_405021, partial [Aspergillus crustosus]